jgi:hypothetical protein
MEITHVIAIIGSIVGILGIFFKREEILSLRGKDFTARLDSTVRFFRDFYSNTDEKKLVLDRAAQEVVRLDFVDFKFIKYLIELDEQYLINFDEILNHYRRGKDFIKYDSLNKEIDINNFILQVPKGRSVKTQVKLYNLYYFICAFIGLSPFLFSSWFNHFLLGKGTPFIFIIFTIFFVVAVFGIAVGSLLQANSLQHADDFMNKLQEAEHSKNT